MKYLISYVILCHVKNVEYVLISSENLLILKSI